MVKLMVKLMVKMGVKVMVNSPCKNNTNIVVKLVLKSRNSQTGGKSGQNGRMVIRWTGARPVHLIIMMTKWIRTSRLSTKNSPTLSLDGETVDEGRDHHLATRGPEVVEDTEHEVDWRGVQAQHRQDRHHRPVPRLFASPFNVRSKFS